MANARELAAKEGEGEEMDDFVSAPKMVLHVGARALRERQRVCVRVCVDGWVVAVHVESGVINWEEGWSGFVIGGA